MTTATTNLVTLIPRNSLVMVRAIKQNQTKAGIIIPEGMGKATYAIGEVLGFGPGTPSVGKYNPDTADLEIGRIILFQTGHSPDPMNRQKGRDDTLPFTVNGEAVILIDERQVVGFVTTGDPS